MEGMLEKGNHGGRRPGSGRKPLDRKPCMLRLTDDERVKVKKYIEELRLANQPNK